MAITDYGIKAALGRAVQATPAADRLSDLALYIPSDLPAGSSEVLDFLGMVPALREWVGPRSAKKPNQFKHSVLLRKFESTIEIPLDWAKNDKSSQVNSLVGQLATRYNPQWRSKRIAALINAASTDLAFDGLAYFSASHVWGDSGTVNNLITFDGAVANVPSANEAASAIVNAVSAMIGFKDDRGEPVNEGISAITIVSPTGAIGAAVMQAVNEKNLDTGTGVRTNPVLGLGLTINVVNTSRVTGLFMDVINASPGAVPFVFLENMTDHMVTSKGAGSDFEHDNDAWQFGVKAVGGAGYGRFTDAVRTSFI